MAVAAIIAGAASGTKTTASESTIGPNQSQKLALTKRS